MGIKYNNEKNCWEAFCSERHPITRMPVTLRRQARSEAEAKRIEKQLVIEVHEKVLQKTIPKWNALMTQYFNVGCIERQISQKTIENHRVCLTSYTGEIWGTRLIDSISTDEIRKLVSQTERSESHKKNLLKFIRLVFSYGVDCNLLQRNPTPAMKFRVGDKIKGVLTESQIAILLNRAKELNSEWYPHWTFALYTGVRNGELYSLTWDKVNLDEGTVKIDCSWNNVDGFKSTKSGDDRIIDIAPQLLTVLKELRLNSNSNFVLPRIDAWDKGEQAKHLRFFLEGLNLPRIRFHDLRASWATVMLSKGIEPIKVMKMAGWKDLKTMQIYIRKAGIDIKGITSSLNLHNPSNQMAKVFNFSRVVDGSDS